MVRVPRAQATAGERGVRVPGVGEARESATTPASAPPIPPPPSPHPFTKMPRGTALERSYATGDGGPVPSREGGGVGGCSSRQKKGARGVHPSPAAPAAAPAAARPHTHPRRPCRPSFFFCLLGGGAQNPRTAHPRLLRGRAARARAALAHSFTPLPHPFHSPSAPRAHLHRRHGRHSLSRGARAQWRGRERARATGPAARMRFVLRVRHPGIAQPHPSNPSVNAHSSLFTPTIPGHRRPLAPVRPLAARGRSVSATSRARPPPRFFLFFLERRLSSERTPSSLLPPFFFF